MGEEAQYIARYATQIITGRTFTEVGDVLRDRGFDLVNAEQTHHGVLIVPHRKPDRMAARLFRQVDPVEEAHKAVDAAGREPPTAEIERPPVPTQVEVAAAMLAGAKVEAGLDEGVGLICRACGAVHPEGVVCLIPIFYEKRCCLEQTYAHEGPHEAAGAEGLITHRWIEELVITDLPFNAYSPTYESEGDDV